MTPITPGGTVTNLCAITHPRPVAVFNSFLTSFFYPLNSSSEHRASLKHVCPKNEALASNEFIAKCKVKEQQDTRIEVDQDLRNLTEQMESANLSDGSDESEETPNGQM